METVIMEILHKIVLAPNSAALCELNPILECEVQYKKG